MWGGLSKGAGLSGRGCRHRGKGRPGLFHRWDLGRMHPTQRGRLIRHMGDVIVKHADRLGEIETRDSGKLSNNITPALKSWQTDSFYYYAGLCDKMGCAG